MKPVRRIIFLSLFISFILSNTSFGAADIKSKSKIETVDNKKDKRKGFFQRLKTKFSFKKRTSKSKARKNKKAIMRHTHHARSFSKFSMKVAISALIPFIHVILLPISFLIGIIHSFIALHKIKKSKTKEDYSDEKDIVGRAIGRLILALIAGTLISRAWVSLLFLI